MKVLFGILLIVLSTDAISQIRISEPTQHLGDIFESKGVVKTKFKLFNPYLEDTIKIININTSCGCTAILTEERIIPPRKTLELVVAYDPKNRPGLFVKTIKVETITGKNERNSLYLKISGNVISEKAAVKEPKNKELTEYKVAPVYYYAVTPYDTSYLDFSYLVSFINDLTFEVDYYQFSTVGIEVEVDDYSQIAEIDNLLRFSRNKIRRGFMERGFDPNRIIFAEPVYKKSEIPVWATARIKLHSYYFNDDTINKSTIKVSDGEEVEDEKLLLNYSRYQLPDIEDVMKEVNYDRIESNLFLNGNLHLKGMIRISEKTSVRKTAKLLKSLEKSIYKKLKKNAGISKENVVFELDSVLRHPDRKIILTMWDRADEKGRSNIKQVIKPDNIQPPQLPTYRQSTVFQSSVDMATREFRRFWENILLNSKAGHNIQLMIVSSTSHRPDKSSEKAKHIIARENGEAAKVFLQKKFENETGKKIAIEVKSLVQGPPHNEEFEKYFDFKQFEYLNFIPIVHKIKKETPKPNPYQVNFDYFFKGVDTSSIVFKNSAKYISGAVKKDGYVALRIESSISKIPIEKNRSNLYLAYSRSYESQQRLKNMMKRNLIDPNRIIFTEERNLIQGPEYDGKMPILNYRKYQYLRIVPEKLLRNN